MSLIAEHGSYVPPVPAKGNDMTTRIQAQSGPRRHIWRLMGWGGAVAIILTPLIAMQFTAEVNWDDTDFIVAAIILAAIGGLIELAMHISKNRYFRFGAMFAIFAGFMVVWSNLAVGMIGSNDNPVNLWFGGVLMLAIGGAVLSHHYKGALAVAMLATGGAQAAIGLFAGILGGDVRGGLFTIILSSLWMISGLLFHAARRPG
ncbi:MAG: hypothetical protein IBJ12_11970 [Sphingomonadaceae bacterium]|nr:hypothetical protein [Sphingomonadaceae bacterium]